MNGWISNNDKTSYIQVCNITKVTTSSFGATVYTVDGKGIELRHETTLDVMQKIADATSGVTFTDVVDWPDAEP